MQIARFGVGNRRPEGPPGSRNLQGQVIHSDASGVISELAFARDASIEPHSNPNTTWFVVIEGGGFVRVGDEEARVFAGEAVLWPAGIVHGAWTEQSPMRAIVVELAGAPSAVIEGVALPIGPGEEAAAARAQGALAPREESRYDPREGEPY